MRNLVLSLCFSALVGCTYVDYREDQLYPTQTNWEHGAVEFIVHTEGVVSREERSWSKNVLWVEYPVRIVLFARAPAERKIEYLVIDRLLLSDGEEFSAELLSEPLKMSLSVPADIGPASKWKDARSLLNYGLYKEWGRDVFFSDWIHGIEKGKKYKLVVDYTDWHSAKQRKEIYFDAREEKSKALWPSFLYWNSI